jgi:hypothetical protein
MAHEVEKRVIPVLHAKIVGEGIPELEEQRDGTETLSESCVFAVNIGSQGNHSLTQFK